MPLTPKKWSMGKPGVHRLPQRPSGLAGQIEANVSTFLEHLDSADKVRRHQGRCRAGFLNYLRAEEKRFILTVQTLPWKRYLIDITLILTISPLEPKRGKTAQKRHKGESRADINKIKGR